MSYSTGAPVAGSWFAEAIRRDFTPAIMALTTDAVEFMCQKNGLSFVEMLRPHCQLRNINVPVRTASEQPYRLQDFQLRLFHALDIIKPKPEAAEDYLTQMIASASEEALAEVQGGGADRQALLQHAGMERPNSWFLRYVREFNRSLSFSEHEFLDHPVACLLVVPSSAKDPINTFVDIFNTEQLPALYNEQIMDPKILKHFVLLHDMQDGDLQRAEEILVQMRGTFGASNCRLLCINSGQPEDSSRHPDIWTPLILPSLFGNSTPLSKKLPSDNTAPMSPKGPPEKLGAYLSDADLHELSEFVVELAVKQIIPHMEQKIRGLNHQITATRKGLKNQLKNLWWRKEKDAPESGKSDQGYLYTSVESQIRLLSDYAFMLRDYDLAQQHYRLLSGDYKTDKAWKHYAGTLEMIGLSLFMLGQSAREAEASLEGAVSTYQRSGPLNARYAVRAGVWLANVFQARGMFREAAAAFQRIAMEESSSLRGGLFLEQAAWSFLRAQPAMWKKFGFHMVLAGHRYSAASQRKHAIRTYTYVLSCYSDREWAYISDHLNWSLGRLHGALSDNLQAVDCFKNLLACPHQSPATQSAFLREFLYFVQAVDLGSGNPLPLDLPQVDVEWVSVLCEDHRTYASPAAAALPHQTWRGLEDGLIPTTNVVVTWMDRPAKVAGEVLQTNTCVSGEEIGVDVAMTNPLAIAIDIACCRLVCQWSPSTAPKPGLPRTTSSPALDFNSESDTGSGTTSPIRDDRTVANFTHHHGHGPRVASMGSLKDRDPDDSPKGFRRSSTSGRPSTADSAQGGPTPGAPGLPPPAPKRQSEGDGRKEGEGTEEEEDVGPSFRVFEETFSIKAGEKSVVRLRVAPLHEGMLKVIGVEWILCNIARGRKDFAIKVPRKRRKGAGGSSGLRGLEKDCPPSKRLAFRVIPPMPKLGLVLHQLPEKLYQGELRRVVLELSNSCSVPLKRLKLRCSHPGMVSVGQPGDMEAEFPACLEAGTQQPPPTADPGSSKNSYTYTFPQSVVLEGSSTLLWPVWLHARDSGLVTFHTVVYYEPETVIPGMKYRTLRVTHSLQVLPSLLPAVSLLPSPSNFHRHLLRLDIQNKHSQDTFRVRQISCAGGSWRLSPLPAPPPPPPFFSPPSAPPPSLKPGQATSLFLHWQAAEASEAQQSEGPFSPAGTGSTPGGGQSAVLTTNLCLGAPAQKPIDIGVGPLWRFHLRERFLQPRGRELGGEESKVRRSSMEPAGPVPETSPLDVVVIWEVERQREQGALQDIARIGSVHVCHQSLQGLSPVRWVIEGPSTITHDFQASPLREVSFTLAVRNCSHATADISIDFTNPSPAPKPSTGGWARTSSQPSPSPESATGTSTPKDEQPCGTPPAPPYIWSGTTRRVLGGLAPSGEARLPVRVVLFGPGVYDLSSYKVSWTLVPVLQGSAIAEQKKEGHARPPRPASGGGAAPPKPGGPDKKAGENASETGSGSAEGASYLLTVVQSQGHAQLQ